MEFQHILISFDGNVFFGRNLICYFIFVSSLDHLHRNRFIVQMANAWIHENFVIARSWKNKGISWYRRCRQSILTLNRRLIISKFEQKNKAKVGWDHRLYDTLPQHLRILDKVRIDLHWACLCYKLASW